MKDVTLFYKVVRQSPLAGIWRQAAYAQGMTGINLFVKSNIAAFSGNGRVTDYEKLHFSFGGLPQGDCFRVVGGSSGISLDIYWENAILLNEGRCADRFMAVVLFENRRIHRLYRLGEYLSENRLPCPDPFAGGVSPASSGLLFLCSCKR